jgi:hypothetical protein
MKRDNNTIVKHHIGKRIIKILKFIIYLIDIRYKFTNINCHLILIN